MNKDIGRVSAQQAWFDEIEPRLPVAVFPPGEPGQPGLNESEMALAMDRRCEQGHPCCRCGEIATSALLSTKDMYRWVDLCAACNNWMRGRS